MAKARGLPVLAYLTHSASAAVDFAGLAGPREGLLMAPTYAVPQMLDRAGIRLQRLRHLRNHEAFAAQVLCTLKAWESEDYCRAKLGRAALGAIDRKKMNPKDLASRSATRSPPPGRASFAMLAKPARRARLRPGPDFHLHRGWHGRDRDPGTLAQRRRHRPTGL